MTMKFQSLIQRQRTLVCNMALKGLHRLELTNTPLIQDVAREQFLQQPQNQFSNAAE